MCTEADVSVPSLFDLPAGAMHATVDAFQWSEDGRTLHIPFETRGTGPPVLLLNALSTTATREEMRSLSKQLQSHFTTVTVDWPGFGEAPRPPLQYTPALYRRFLDAFVRETFAPPVSVVAAGHGAGYVLHLAQQTPSPWRRMALVAPTWRGPLPTAMGTHRWIYRRLEQLVRLPGLGPVLYHLNTTAAFIGWMYRRHVYGDPTHVTADLIQKKQSMSRRLGARYAAAAFVTGALDPMRSRKAFVDALRAASAPVCLLIGEQTPPGSRREMEALADTGPAEVHRLPGALGMHEEFPEAVADALRPFLRAAESSRSAKTTP